MKKNILPASSGNKKRSAQCFFLSIFLHSIALGGIVTLFGVSSKEPIAPTKTEKNLGKLPPASPTSNTPALSSLADPRYKEVRHLVKPGESLWKIAKNYQVSLKELTTINDISPEYILRTGDVLKIPPKSPAKL